MTKTKPTRVLFVCLGNICRSPAAEGVFRQIVEKQGLSEAFVIDSAGTYSGHQGDLPDHRMRQAAAKRGYQLNHRARPVRTADFVDFDLILAMDDNNLYNLRALAPSPEAEEKIHRMTDYCRTHTADHVPDPYYGGSEGFNHVLDLLEDACAGLLEDILC